MRLVPAYTLETLDNCDIYRLLPYYFFDYRMSLRAKEKAESAENSDDTKEDNIVVRNGKKYRVVKADQTSWADKMF